MPGFRRLPLGGIPNLRDLGGWAVMSGVTQCGVFLRSALPQYIDEESEALLRRYDLRTVIDFRSEREAERDPDPLRALDGITYLSMPMFDAAASGAALRIRPEAHFSWAEHYIRMAEQQKDWVCRVMTALAGSEGCALFHCTTGKDRAGIISALILSMCSVCDEDVVADYCVSEIYLRPMYAEMESYSRLCNGNIDAPFYRTEPATMRAFLEHIFGKYGSAAGYLASCGLPESAAARIREKLTGKF